jgi:hypothetical protein
MEPPRQSKFTFPPFALTSEVAKNTLVLRAVMYSEVAEILLENGLITEDQLQLALGAMIQNGSSLVQELVRQKFVDGGRLAEFLAERYRVELVTEQMLDSLPVFIARLISPELALIHRAVPVVLKDGVLYLALDDPTNRLALEAVSFATGYKTLPMVAPWQLLEKALALHYGITPEQLAQQVEAAAESPADNSSQPEPVFITEPPSPPAPEQLTATIDEGLEDKQPVAKFNDLQATQEEKKSPEVVELTRKKDETSADSISDAILNGLERGLGEIIILDQPKKKAPAPPRKPHSEEKPPPPTRSAEGRQAPPAQTVSPVRNEPAVENRQAQEISRTPSEPLSLEQARALMKEITEHDRLGRLIIDFASAFFARTVLLAIRKGFLTGWRGAGEGISSELVKGLLLPLDTPSIFRKVRETGSDYFGPLFPSAVNELFISALGKIRPARVVVIPLTVQHKPLAMLYGDCGHEAAFVRDLSPLHLLLLEAAKKLEELIIRKKSKPR